ncbi:MAG: APC family permease [Candidatus Methanomethylicus sp.]|nr:APC family permease [Candidatus Methanomethylicus sp.]
MEESRITENTAVVSEVKKTADWKVAYIIGLAGTILVTGVAGPIVGGIGSFGWIEVLITVVFGVIYCFLLAELAAMFPEKVGGLPTYAVEGFRDKKWGNILGGFNNWAYFLGWSPVISVNTSLLAIYTAFLGGFSAQFYAGILPIWPQGYLYIFAFTLGITSLLYIVNYLGLQLGYRAALVFAAISLGPLLFLGFAPIFSGAMNWSNIFPINTGITASATLNDWLFGIYPWFFIVTWNALAMEATASYLGECKNPAKDAPKAMTAAAITGLVIYTSLPFAMLGVLGAGGVALDPWAGFISVAAIYAGPMASIIVGVMLWAALLLSTTNALIGCARSLYQSSVEGLTISWLGKMNKYGSPARAMLFGLIFNLMLVLVVAGLPTLIYVVSNVGYLFSFIPTGLAYWRLKRGYKGMPERTRPYSLPKIFGPLSMICVIFFTIIWITAGPLSPYSVYAIGGTALPPIFFWLLGVFILALGIPMYIVGNKGYKKRIAEGTLTEAEKSIRETQKT